jgi:chemotaxis-related protein WspD
MDACWTVIGVRGDHSCPELRQHVHCRNCPVHAAAAVALLECEPATDYIAAWTTHVSAPKAHGDRNAEPLLIFRVDAEWFALPTAVVEEVTRIPPIHSLPHRQRDAVLGVTNIRGTLTPCVSLSRLLALDPPADAPEAHSWRRRCLVIRRASTRVACPVDEVHGILHVPHEDLKDLPATLAKSATRFSRKALTWNERSVGVLEEQPLFAALGRSLK